MVTIWRDEPLSSEGVILALLTYDPRYDVAYFRFQARTVQVETLRISDELNVDLAPDGTIYGIELLNANEQLRIEDSGQLIVVNEALGRSHSVSLTE